MTTSLLRHPWPMSLLLLLVLIGCADPSHDPSRDRFVVKENLNQDDYQRIYNDTVTPPNNPLIPPTEQTYTVSGILQGQYIEALQGYYPCVNKLNTETKECTFYYIYRWGDPIRFDHPDLQDYHIGDTLYLTGQVSYRMKNNITYDFPTHENNWWYRTVPECYCFEYLSITK